MNLMVYNNSEGFRKPLGFLFMPEFNLMAGILQKTRANFLEDKMPKIGFKHSEYSKKKMSEHAKGNLGKHFSNEHKIKIGLANSISVKRFYDNGGSPWNKG